MRSLGFSAKKANHPSHHMPGVTVDGTMTVEDVKGAGTGVPILSPYLSSPGKTIWVLADEDGLPSAQPGGTSKQG